MSDQFEPKRSFRWTLEIPGIKSFMLTRVMFLAEEGFGSLFGQRLRVDYRLAEADSLIRPVPVTGTGVLRFLDEKGAITDQYTLHWDGRVLWPFLDLDYTSGEPVEGRLVLSNVHLVPLPIEPS